MSGWVACPLCEDGEVDVEVQPREPSVGILVGYISEAYACESCGETPNLDDYHDVFLDQLDSAGPEWEPPEERG